MIWFDELAGVRFYSCRLTICLDWITWPPHTLQETSCKKSEIPWSLVEVQEPSWFYEYLLILCLIGVLWIIFYQNSHWGNLYVGASAICNEEFLQEDKESQNVSEHECGRTFWNPTLLRCWSDLWRYDQHIAYGVNSCMFLPLHSCRRLRRIGSPRAGEVQLVAQHTLKPGTYGWKCKRKSIDVIMCKRSQLICTDASSCIQERLAGLVRLQCASGAWT